MSNTVNFVGTSTPDIPAGSTQNLGISYTVGTGVFAVTGSDGSSLSNSNPAYISIPSKATPGTINIYSITADQSFQDANGTSEIIGNLFGLPTGIAYAQDLPFFIFAVVNDAEDAVQFMISRVPHVRSSPASANIGTPSSADADIQGAFFSFDDITTTEYDQNPCVCVGSFRMRMDASDDWTIQTLDNSDGIDLFQENRTFTFPTGAFGAASGTYLKDNGGTAPIFTNNVYTYQIQKNGFVHCNTFLDGDGGTDGAGAVITLLTLPYDTAYPNNQTFGSFYANTVAITAEVGTFQVASGLNNVSSRGASGNILTNNEFPNGTREWFGDMFYKVNS